MPGFADPRPNLQTLELREAAASILMELATRCSVVGCPKACGALMQEADDVRKGFKEMNPTLRNQAEVAIGEFEARL